VKILRDYEQRVIQSLSDPQARLYYRYYAGTRVGDKYLCVVVKVVGTDAFVLTAQDVALPFPVPVVGPIHVGP
jgi:hypothetical protein